MVFVRGHNILLLKFRNPRIKNRHFLVSCNSAQFLLPQTAATRKSGKNKAILKGFMAHTITDHKENSELHTPNKLTKVLYFFINWFIFYYDKFLNFFPFGLWNRIC